MLSFKAVMYMTVSSMYMTNQKSEIHTIGDEPIRKTSIWWLYITIYTHVVAWV